MQSLIFSTNVLECGFYASLKYIKPKSNSFDKYFNKVKAVCVSNLENIQYIFEYINIGVIGCQFYRIEKLFSIPKFFLTIPTIAMSLAIPYFFPKKSEEVTEDKEKNLKVFKQKTTLQIFTIAASIAKIAGSILLAYKNKSIANVIFGVLPNVYSLYKSNELDLLKFSFSNKKVRIENVEIELPIDGKPITKNVISAFKIYNANYINYFIPKIEKNIIEEIRPTLDQIPHLEVARCSIITNPISKKEIEVEKMLPFNDANKLDGLICCKSLELDLNVPVKFKYNTSGYYNEKDKKTYEGSFIEITEINESKHAEFNINLTNPNHLKIFDLKKDLIRYLGQIKEFLAEKITVDNIETLLAYIQSALGSVQYYIGYDIGIYNFQLAIGCFDVINFVAKQIKLCKQTDKTESLIRISVILLVFTISYFLTLEYNLLLSSVFKCKDIVSSLKLQDNKTVIKICNDASQVFLQTVTLSLAAWNLIDKYDLKKSKSFFRFFSFIFLSNMKWLNITSKIGSYDIDHIHLISKFAFRDVNLFKDSINAILDIKSKLREILLRADCDIYRLRSDGVVRYYAKWNITGDLNSLFKATKVANLQFSHFIAWLSHSYYGNMPVY